MPFEGDNQQSQSDSPAQVTDNQSESNLQVSNQESSDFNSQQRDDIKASTSQMVENGTLPELSLHNTANNGSIGVEGGNQSSAPSELKDGMQDKSAVRAGEGPHQVADRLLGEDARNSDVKALTGALREQYRDETNNKDFMMNNLKQGRELLTDKNVDQVLSKIDDPEQRQRIAAQLTENPKNDQSGEAAEKPDASNPKDRSKESDSAQSKDESKPDSNDGSNPNSKDESKPDSKDEPKPDSKDETKQEGKGESKPELKDESKPDAKDGSNPQSKEEAKPEATADEKVKETADAESPEAKEGSIDRSQFDKELSDPHVMAAFAGRMKSEVGSQGADAHVAFAEEVMNRAAARDQTIMEALKGSYYPTHNPGRSSNPEYHEAITKAWKEGTDTIEGATGNASGRVGFGAGRARRNAEGEMVAPNQTVNIGGERFGYEQVDLNRGWMDEYKRLKRGD